MTQEQSKERLDKAKDKSLVSLLRQQGYAITETGSYYRCLSPLRIEGNGSFDISKKTGRWKDRGNGKSGDIVDYIMLTENKTFHEAIDFLLGDKASSIEPYVPEKRTREAIEIIQTSEIVTPYLIDYIRSRMLDFDTAKHYLIEAKIRFPYAKTEEGRAKIHTVCAFKNDSGGYEFRNKYRKVSNLPKNITTIHGVHESNIVCIYEGWPDFLSYLTHYGYARPEYNTIILNSTSFLGAVIPMLQGKLVFYWGQNDSPGEKAYRRMKREGLIVTDKRYVFKGYKDFNVYLVKNSQKKLSKILAK